MNCCKTQNLQIRVADLKAVRGGESALAMAKRRYTTVDMLGHIEFEFINIKQIIKEYC